MMEHWYAYLDQLSRQFGTGDVSTDLMGITLVISFLALIVGLVSYRRERSHDELVPSVERMQAMNGRLEKIERTLNEFRTEMLRQGEIARGNIEFAKGELVTIRDGIDDLLQRKGSGTRTPSSGGTPGSSGTGGFGQGGGSTEGTDGSSLSPSDLDRKGTQDMTSGDVSSLVQELQQIDAAQSPVIPVEEPVGLFGRLKRSRQNLVSKVRGFFGAKKVFDPSMMDQLEELLITGDMGVKTTMEVIAEVQAKLSRGQNISQDELLEMLRDHIAGVLADTERASAEVVPAVMPDGPFVVLLVGVNGAGKTTTVAKLAHQWRADGKSVMVAAADTFRAAAVEQLKEWADRVQVPVISGPTGSKPATVVYDAMVAAKRDKIDVLIIDTAGRLQNKANLMQELEGIRNVMSKHQASAPHEVLLVVDGSSGQNALNQAREFNTAVNLTGVVITKLDGTPKGGIVVAIKSDLGIPVRYIGIGEKREDLKVFEPREFAEALINLDDGDDSSSVTNPASPGDSRANIH